MKYHPETESYIWEKVKVVLDLSSCTTKKELKQATGIDTSETRY